LYVLLAVLGLVLTGTGAIKLGSSLLSYHAARTAQAATVPAGQQTDGSSGAAAPDTSASTPTAPAIRPTRIEIPGIHVDAPVQLLGLTSTGTLAVPTQTNQAGWYTGSAVPGQPGPTVIAGHLDTTSGPAVFVDLPQLEDGDEIRILLSTGAEVDYQVTGMQTDPKVQFPTTQVYGPSPDSELRLITCTGSVVDGSYLDNLIVFARLDTSASS
jgi:LPXTG-site transpeptidase (sortase) family protein